MTKLEGKPDPPAECGLQHPSLSDEQAAAKKASRGAREHTRHPTEADGPHTTLPATCTPSSHDCGIDARAGTPWVTGPTCTHVQETKLHGVSSVATTSPLQVGNKNNMKISKHSDTQRHNSK